MTKKAPLIFLTIAVMLLVYFAIKPTNIEIEDAPKLAYNFVKCTPAKFLLEGIDTTKQISPLFNNLGNLHFNISSSNERA
jgi:hypothetical protein